MPLSKNKILSWLDQNVLLLLSGFLIAFIPLFPKIPFFSPIEEYIVRVRIEDFLVLLTIIVWFVQLLRKKIKFKSLTTFFIIAYGLVGLLSVVSAVCGEIGPMRAGGVYSSPGGRHDGSGELLFSADVAAAGLPLHD